MLQGQYPWTTICLARMISREMYVYCLMLASVRLPNLQSGTAYESKDYATGQVLPIPPVFSRVSAFRLPDFQNFSLSQLQISVSFSGWHNLMGAAITGLPGLILWMSSAGFIYALILEVECYTKWILITSNPCTFLWFLSGIAPIVV